MDSQVGEADVLRIAAIGLTETEYRAVEQALLESGLTANLQRMATADFPSTQVELVITNESEETIRVLQTLNSRPDRPDVFVLVDGWDEQRVQTLMNHGVSRVFSRVHPANLQGRWVETIRPALAAWAGQRTSREKAVRLPGPGVFIAEPNFWSVMGFKGSFSPNEIVSQAMNKMAAVNAIIDPEGTLLYLNQHGERVSGYSLEEARGRNIRDLFLAPEEEAGVFENFQELLNGKPSTQHRNAWINRSGKAIQLEWVNTLLQSEPGGDRYIFAVGVDVSEGFERQAPVQEMANLLRRIFASNPVGIALLESKSGRFLDANRRFLDLLQRSQEELKTLSPPDLGLLSYEQDWREGVLQKVQQQPFISSERKVLVGEGELKFLRITYSAIDLQSGPGVLLTIVDQSERLAGEEETRRLHEELEGSILERSAALEATNRELKSEVAFRKALESSAQRLIQILWETPDVVHIADLNWQLQYLNKAGRQLLGIGETDSVAGLSMLPLYSEAHREELKGEIAQHVEDYGVWRGDTELYLSDERVIPISKVIIGHRDAQGKVQFYSAISRDISEMIRASRELRQTVERERELGRLRGSFFSMTSHQFRTPLSTILSSAELLELYVDDWQVEKRRTHIRRIQNAAVQISDMLTDILEYSKVEARGSRPKPEAFDVEMYCRKFFNETSAGSSALAQLALDCPESPCIIYSDRSALELVIENILSNAVKFSGKSGKIRVSIQILEGDAAIVVQDEGIGIPEDDQKLIFEPFHRGSNVVGVPGSGLGLMIVRKALELIHGEIDIRSAVGQGTAVTVRVPDLRRFVKE